MVSLSTMALVASGGAIGAMARYGVGLVLRSPAGGFPYATLSVNVIGSLAMGLLVGWLARQATPQENIRLFLAIGLFGGFTTFSSFSLDLFELLERRDVWQAAGYVLGSVLLAFGALLLGYTMSRGSMS